jgi:hypothetical protein
MDNLESNGSKVPFTRIKAAEYLTYGAESLDS